MTLGAPPPIRFDVTAAEAAGEAWDMNCGPGAICGLLGLTPDEVRPHMGDFELRGYTNPTTMKMALRSLGAGFIERRSPLGEEQLPWPSFGLVRIQWAGPWTKPGVPIRARYRQTHWVASWKDAAGDGHRIFDINATCAGGWLSFFEWKTQLVPWLLTECVPKAYGDWWPTHALTVTP